MEVVYYPRYPSWDLTKPTKMKRRSLMQRLSSWFEDHLPLRRRSDVRRSERGGGGSRRKVASKSVAPRMRYSVTNAQKQNDLVVEHQQHQQQQSTTTSGGPLNTMSMSMIGKDSIYDDGYTDHHRYHSYIDDMSVSTFSHLGPRQPPPSFNDAPLSQSFSSSTYSSCRRPRIRTNPWISSSSNSQRSSSSSHTQQSHGNSNNNNNPHSSSMIFRSPQQPSTSLASRSIYSAPDALSASAAPTSQQQPQQQKQQQQQTLKPPELLYSSMDRTAQLRVKSLDESTCSSGYGSQDSSPESSVHSPDWQQGGQQIRVEDKSVETDNNNSTVAASTISTNGTMMGLRSYYQHPNLRPQQHHHHVFDEDEHVYHELESLHRLSLLLEERACSSEGEFLSPQPTQEEKPSPIEADEDSRTSSPIYAVPYDSQRNSLCSENPLLPQFISTKPSHLGNYENPYARVQPLSIESPFFQKQPSMASNYAIPFRCPSNSVAGPQWHCPPPPPLEDTNGNSNVGGDVDFLAELDKQIAELQIQSDAVRHLVEQAKERQELRERTRILCMEHINELRKMRWFMRNNFELCL